MTQKQAYMSDPKKLLADIESLKTLKTQYDTELTMQQSQRDALIKSTGIDLSVTTIDEHIAKLTAELEAQVASLNIPEDLINGHSGLRKTN